MRILKAAETKIAPSTGLPSLDNLDGTQGSLIAEPKPVVVNELVAIAMQYVIPIGSHDGGVEAVGFKNGRDRFRWLSFSEIGKRVGMKNLKKNFALFLLTLLGICGILQSSTARAESSKLHFVNSGGMFSSDKVSDGKKIYDSDQLQEIIKTDPQAVEYMNAYNRNSHYILATYISGAALLVTGIILTNSHPGPALGIDVGAIALFFWSAHFMGNARSNYLKSINHFNGVRETAAAGRSSASFGLVPIRSGAAMAMNWRF